MNDQQWELYLDEMAAKGVLLWPHGDQLTIEGDEEVLTDETLHYLSTHKAAILQVLRQSTRYHPLSYGQRALWFEQQMDASSFAYNVSIALRILAPVEPELLEDSFQQLVNRHAALRTCFPIIDAEPVQQIYRYRPVQMMQINASGWSDATLQQAVNTAHEQPFDLTYGPLFRLNLYQFQQDEIVLLFTMHHLICDGWSIWQLLDELLQVYPALRTDVPLTLPSVQSDYTSYVDWQAQILAEQEERLWGYWQQKLAGELPILHLPTDRPRRPLHSRRGASIPLTLCTELTQQLTTLAQSEGVTLYMLLLAAFQILLHRYSGQDDILVGSPFAGRSRPEFAQTVGYLVNPLVMRANCAGNPSFRDFLLQVRQTVLDAFAHQDYPFARLVERLQPARQSGVSVVSQAVFALQRSQINAAIVDLATAATTTPVELGGLRLSPFPIAQYEGQSDLFLELFYSSTALRGSIKYDMELFDKATIERLAGHFQSLLKGIIAHPTQPIGTLSLLTAAEQHQLLVEWNATTTDYPQDKCIHHLFEEQLTRTPDAVAVVMADPTPSHPNSGRGQGRGDDILTYAELNARANQLAHHLQGCGVGPEVLVGVCLERSLDVVVALLAIFKAGGVYVPLDPTYPPERLAYMVGDAQLAHVITQEKLLPLLADKGGQLICLDRDWDGLIDQAPAVNLLYSVDGNHAAYMIYTSGSTGQPKGVVVEHRSLALHCRAMQEHYALTAQDCVLQFASFSFDVSLEQLLPALISGARVIIGQTWDTYTFTQQMLRHQWSVIDLPPAYLHLLLQSWIETPALLHNHALRLLIVGNDVLPPTTVALWRQSPLKDVRLINAYGPTETTITATCYDLPRTPETTELRVPIGRPIAHKAIYLLDANQQPVPLGVPGELYISGAGVARGYWRRPEVTAEKFVALQSVPGTLYRTGDLARYLPAPDGGPPTIEFLGRVDHQVKLRGFRIELGEIEVRLNQDPAIKEAVVLLQQEQQPFLEAFVVLNNDLTVKEERYQIFTAAQNPLLQKPMEQVHLQVWPRFFEGDAVSADYWYQIYQTFPEYQIALMECHEVIAVCNAIPLYWDGRPETLPSGWDAALVKGFTDWEQSIQANTLCILAGSVSEKHQSQGLSYELLKIMKSIAFMTGELDYVIAPVRPSHKHHFPALTLEAYCRRRRDDGFSSDPWLRVHERLQGTIIQYAEQSQLVEGTIEQWECWTGEQLTKSGEYLFDGCMQPVQIDLAQNRGIYYDLAVWMRHKPEPYLSFNPSTSGLAHIRQRLAAYLPDYMVPSAFRVLEALPLTANGKVDRRALHNGNFNVLGGHSGQGQLHSFGIDLAKIEEKLLEAPIVKDAVVLLRQDRPDEKQLVAYVAPHLIDASLQIKHLAEHQSVYETLYSELPTDQEHTFVTTGWNSSYTGLPIPAVEMQEWVEQTIASILRLKPTRILEIGCGTGMLLTRLAPICMEYWGTDYSQEVINYLEQVKQNQPSLQHVQLRHCLAHEFAALPRNAFDLVIINSVIQYFPSADYLLQVMAGAMQTLVPGGSLYIGDVRNFNLAKAYQASLLLYQATDDLTSAALATQVEHELQHGNELLVAPEFFYALPGRFPQIQQVQVSLERGHYHNELTRFRYQVSLQLAAASSSSQSPALPEPWSSSKWSLAALHQQLAEHRPEMLTLTGIPNARLDRERVTLAWLDHCNQRQHLESVAQLRQSIAEHPTGIDPADLWDLGEALGYHVEVTWSRSGEPSEMDVIFCQQRSDANDWCAQFPTPQLQLRPWSTYTSQPLLSKLMRTLPEQLTHFLQQALPDYMVPTAFVLLDSLPHTLNGKVDRKALPAPTRLREGNETTYAAPQTPTERTLAAIWTEVLGIERVGRHDNFFELGGHSLLTIQVMSRIKQRLDANVPLSQFFAKPTVAQLSETIEQAGLPAIAKVALQPIARDRDFPLSFVQEEAWLGAATAGNIYNYNDVAAIQLVGTLNIEALHQAINALIQRHEILRTTYKATQGSQWRVVQSILPSAEVALPLVDLSGTAAEDQTTEIAQWLQSERQTLIDFTRAPSLRTTLLRLASEKHLLIMTLHHITGDNYSGGILQRELALYYRAFVTDQPLSLPPLPIQYADFAWWQRQTFTSALLAERQSYWQRLLATPPTLLTLYTDFPRPMESQARAYPVHNEWFAMSPELSEQIASLSRQAGTTLAITLLAGYAALLHHYSDCTDLLLGTPINRRNFSELEGVVGYLSNVSLLRLNLTNRPSWRELIERARNAMVETIIYQDITLRQLLQTTGSEWLPGKAPRPQANFNFLPEGDGNLDLPDLTVTPYGAAGRGYLMVEFSLLCWRAQNNQGEQVIQGFFAYRPDLFKPSTVQQMIENFQLLLTAMVTDPDQMIDQANLIIN